MAAPALGSLGAPAARRLTSLHDSENPSSRLLHALTDAGSHPLHQRVGIYLTDTLSEPGAATPMGSLGFMSAEITHERGEADHLKQGSPILEIVGNPPYRRLKTGETAELVGNWMDGIWEDLKEPVRLQGWGGELNTFPDLYIAFWRWSLWRLFDAPGATGRGIVCFITNRTFLAGHPFAGLRQMMRQRFDKIEIFDLRGNIRQGARAGIEGDQGVFDIQAGTAITLCWSTGSKQPGQLAEVTYFDAWAAGAFTREQKLSWLASGAGKGALNGGLAIDRGALDDMRPVPFQGRNWPSLAACFRFKSSGIETKRDPFVYDFSAAALEAKIRSLPGLAIEEANELFNPTDMNSVATAISYGFDASKIEKVGYRPFDNRDHYSDPNFNDRLRPDLQAIWGSDNICLFTLPGGISVYLGL